MHRTFHSSASYDAPSFLSQHLPTASPVEQSTLPSSDSSVSRAHSTHAVRRLMGVSLSFALFGACVNVAPVGASPKAPQIQGTSLGIELQSNKVLLSTSSSSRVLI